MLSVRRKADGYQLNLPHVNNKRKMTENNQKQRNWLAQKIWLESQSFPRRKKTQSIVTNYRRISSSRLLWFPISHSFAHFPSYTHAFILQPLPNYTLRNRNELNHSSLNKHCESVVQRRVTSNGIACGIESNRIVSFLANRPSLLQILWQVAKQLNNDIGRKESKSIYIAPF